MAQSRTISYSDLDKNGERRLHDSIKYRAWVICSLLMPDCYGMSRKVVIILARPPPDIQHIDCSALNSPNYAV